MEKEKVFHFVFAEDKINPKDKLEPFVFEMLQTNIPCIFVTDEPMFSLWLDKFSNDQLISVWVHHQASSLKTDEYGRYLGENIGAKLINKYPKLKFKYLTRAPKHPAKSGDKNQNPIISLNDIYGAIKDENNFQLISDFNITESEQSSNGKDVKTGTGGSLID